MSFDKTMLSIAMESGEVLPEQNIHNTEVDADELYE